MTNFDLSEYEAPMQITAEIVLNQVDDLLIYRQYLGIFTLGGKVKNPFRKDNHPSFSIFFGSKLLKLLWKDFATGDSGDCFSLVGKIYGLTYPQAVEKVAMDFGLIKGQPTVTKKQIQEARAFKEEFQKREYLIQVARRPMDQEELDYWAQYNINKEDLKSNNIFAIDKLWINKRLMHLSPTLHFAYYFPTTDKWKIYSPFDKDYKWFGNVSTYEMEGLEKTMYVNKPVIVTKSRKDRIVLSKLYHNVVSSQNESEAAIPKENDDAFSKFPSKYCWFDSDEPGKNANRKLNHRGYKWINIANHLYEKLGLKDPSDVVKHFGWEEGSKILINEMHKKGIL
jgi:hypothetical protein